MGRLASLSESEVNVSFEIAESLHSADCHIINLGKSEVLSCLASLNISINVGNLFPEGKYLGGGDLYCNFWIGSEST